VRSVTKKQGGITKQVVVTLAEGQESTVDNGFLSADKLIATLGCRPPGLHRGDTSGGWYPA
jgi:hypothetical protein